MEIHPAPAGTAVTSRTISAFRPVEMRVLALRATRAELSHMRFSGTPRLDISGIDANTADATLRKAILWGDGASRLCAMIYHAAGVLSENNPLVLRLRGYWRPARGCAAAMSGNAADKGADNAAGNAAMSEFVVKSFDLPAAKASEMVKPAPKTGRGAAGRDIDILA